MTTNKENRKKMPIFSGVLMYFPDAIAEVAKCSYQGNLQHHPDKPLHWDKSKSSDHGDALLRHLMESGTVDNDNIRHSAKVAWRALALLQIELDKVKSCIGNPSDGLIIKDDNIITRQNKGV
tara:strand:- start:4202 stop:4567 length:366 start_codon:yes stop_codon:yes gene_type:complete